MRQAQTDCFTPLRQRLRRVLITLATTSAASSSVCGARCALPLPYNQAARAAQLTRI